ncbi:ABC transporter substrate-binding protein, partial [Ralstonia insidiosa]|nr:ABC transporter substrate-binding protein [Ralstonia insidiosa]
SSKITDVIKKETDTKPLSFHNLAVLTKEEQNDDSISYQSLMKKNIYVLNRALNN